MNKKIAMIIASKNFRDEEYAMPKKVFEANGYQVTTASSKTGTIRGMLGDTVTPDTLYTSIDPKDYDAVIFVGGGGAREYFNDSTAHAIAKKTLAENKVLGAICIAPSILANAGLLLDKKAVVFSSEEANLESKGAILQPGDVAKDGNIVTATGPNAAKSFGKKIVESLKSV
jgi:protease I